MDYIFFRLPPELRQLTLQFLPDHDLDVLFQLHHLLQPPDAYLIVRNQALAARYHRLKLVMSNDRNLGNFTLADLQYLIENRIFIQPADITFAVYDFTNYPVLVEYMRSLFREYLPYLVKFTTDFNIRLILTENVTLDNSLLRFAFEPLCSPQYNVNWFTIKYLPGTGRTTRENSVEMDLNLLLASTNEICIENLQLHLFSSSNLLKHLVDTDGCFYCENLRTLDLSYNNLTEWSLRNLKFPETLQLLNLSNNQLHHLSNSNFQHRNLTNLKVLNLSNNNLRKVELHDYREAAGPYQLEHLDLSGNILSEYGGMFQSSFFANLKSVNLSLNLIEKVSSFPSLVTSIDLSGNYLDLNFCDVKRVFPSGLRKLCVGSSGDIRQVIEDAGLWDLEVLDVCSGRQCPCQV